MRLLHLACFALLVPPAAPLLPSTGWGGGASIQLSPLATCAVSSVPQSAAGVCSISCPQGLWTTVEVAVTLQRTSAELYHCVPKPVLTSLAPPYIYEAVNTQLAVTGSNFYQSPLGVLCKYGDSVSKGNFESLNLVTCEWTPLLAGSYPLSLSFNRIDWTDSVTVTVKTTPRVVGVSSSAQYAPATLTVTGAYFVAGLVCSFSTGETTSLALADSHTGNCGVPSGVDGPVNVQVLDALKVAVSRVFAIAFFPKVKLITLTPSYLFTDSAFDLFGSVFDATMHCAIDGTAVSTVYVSSLRLQCSTASQSPGPHTVSILSASGTEIAASPLAITLNVLKYTFTATIQSQSVSIQLRPSMPAGTVLCAIGRNPPAPAVRSGDTITCSISAIRDVGTMCVELSANYGHDYTSDCQVQVRLPRKSRTTAVSKTSVSVRGDGVVVTAVRYDQESQYRCRVSFPDATVSMVPASLQSAHELKCALPAASQAGSGSLTVTQDSTLVLESYPLAFIAPLALHSVRPSRILLEGGSLVTLSGAGFPTPNRCLFTTATDDQTQVDAVTATDAAIACVSPAFGSEGTVSISLLEFNGEESQHVEVTVVQGAKVEKLTPELAFEGMDTQLFVTGSGFLDVPGLSVRLDLSGDVVSAVFVSPTLLKATFKLLHINHFLHEYDTVSVSLNGQDFTGSFPLAVYPSPSMGVLSIPKGPWQGDYSLVIYGNGLETAGECVFGESVGPLTPINYQSADCHVPLANPGLYPVLLRVLGSEFHTKPQLFAFIGFSQYSFSPRSGPLAGGTLITFNGDFAWIAQDDTVRCSFGGKLVLGTFSKGVLTCVTPPHPSSDVVYVHVIVNNFDYSQVGLVLEQFFYEVDPDLEVAGTFVWPSIGGTLIEIAGSGFQWRSAWKCHFGPLSADLLVLTESRAACFSPHTVNGLSDTLRLSANQQHFVQFAEDFAVINDPSIYQGAPLTGPRAGGTEVTLIGDFLSPITTCRFGDSRAVPATAVDSHTVQCLTPEWDYPDRVPIDVSANGQLFTASGLLFEYYDLPDVLAVSPRLVPAAGGTVMTVVGEGFREYTVCRVLGSLVDSEVVSKKELKCVSPQSPAGVVEIELSCNGQQFHSFLKAAYTAYAQLSISTIAPSAGVAGTVVSISGTGFIDDGQLSCRFGDVEATWVRLLSSQLLKCEVPLLPAGSVAVAVSVNGVEFAQYKSFVVHWELEVVSAYPHYSSPDGGTQVTLNTLNWPTDTSLARCKFAIIDPLTHTSKYSSKFQDSFIVTAAVDGRTVKCVAPSNVDIGTAKVKVTVTSELQIYSSSGASVLYIESSFGGFYRQGSNQIECPIGHYCRVESWYAPQPCEVGYWQSHKRQRKCSVCSKGAYCPDRTMSTTIICPAGKICAARGSSAPMYDCRPGFYCVEGTTTTSFWDDSPYGVKQRLCSALGHFCVSGSSDVAELLPCTVGFYCPYGAKEHHGTVQCLSGYYCIESEVIPCPPRYFCPGRGEVAPQPCLPGTFNPSFGQSSCRSCTYGFICPHSAMLLPQQCPIGYVCQSTGLTNPITMCSAGYYCDGEVMSSYTSRPCRVISDFDTLTLSFCGAEVMIKKTDPDNISPQMPHFTGKPENLCCWAPERTAEFLTSVGVAAGSEAVFARASEEALSQRMNGMDLYRLLNSQNSTRQLQHSRAVSLSLLRPPDIDNFILALQSLLVLKQQLPCPPGMFCLKKTGSNSTSSQRLPPYECNPGTYCKLAASTPQGTGLCPPGYYCPPGTSEPIKTAEGYRAQFEGNVNPAPCMPGEFSNQENAADCMTCPSGFECSSSGTVWPSICPPGTYRTSGSMSRCGPCPVRTWTYEKGVTALPFCLPCTTGRLCSDPGMKSVTQTYPCIEGDVCGEASDLKSREGCPAGFLCGLDTAPDEAHRYECIEGFFCKFRMPMRNKYLLQCPTFAYCPPASTDYDAFYLTTLADFAGSWPPWVCPLGTGDDGKSGKKHLLDCKTDDHYLGSPSSRLIEVSPVITSLGTAPSGFVTYSNTSFPAEIPFYELQNFDLALITIDLRHINLPGKVTTYGVDWSVAIHAVVGAAADRDSQAPVEMPLNFLSESLAKNTVLEFTLEAWSRLNLTVSIFLFNGLLLAEREAFMNVATIEVFTPNHANFGTRDVFVLNFKASVALPINMPSTESDILPDYILSFAQSPHRYAERPTPRAEGKNWFTPNSLFWQGAASYSTTYLPYFSNCKGYGAYIPLWTVLERSRTCDLVAPGNTTYVSSFDFGALPNADSCSNVTIECIYDEVPSDQEPVPRWWEVPYPSTLFEISQLPVSVEDFLNGAVGKVVPVTINNPSAGSGLPRTVTLEVRYQQLDTKTKKIITATITLSDFQELTADQNSGAAITKYTLVVNFSALSHTELMILFQFPVSFYSVLNLLIGSVQVAVCLSFLGYHRLVAMAKPIPRVKFWGYAVMSLPPVFTGMVLAMVPVYTVLFFISIFVQGTLWSYVIPYPGADAIGKTRMGIFDSITPAYDPMQVDDMTTTRNCRVVISFLLVGLYLLYASAAMFHPARDDQELLREDPRGNVSHTLYWQRFSFFFLSVMTSCGLVLLVFFSFSKYFALNPYPSVVAMEFVSWVYEESVGPIIGAGLLKTPIIAAFSVVKGMCFFGTGTFVDYLQAGFVDFTVMLYGRIYHTDIMNFIVDSVKDAFEKAKKTLRAFSLAKLFRPATVTQQPLTPESGLSMGATGVPEDERSLSSFDDSDSESYFTEEEVEQSPLPSEPRGEDAPEQEVEPLLDYCGGYAADTIGVVYVIILTTVLWYFYDATQIAATYGLDLVALPMYFLFSVMMLPITLIVDVILHNCNDYFNGWAIHDFFDHCHVRFKTRTARWALLDTRSANFVDEEFRTLYVSCLSSQFYFMCTIHCSGMVLVAIAITTLVSNEDYNVFQDRALIALVPFILILCGLVHAATYYAGIRLGIWKLQEPDTRPPRHREDSFREMVEIFMQRSAPRTASVVPSISNWSQVDLIKASDEAIQRQLQTDRVKDNKIREMFLQENRRWLQAHLAEILTVKAMRKHRAVLLASMRELFGKQSLPPSPRSYSDVSSQEGELQVGESTTAMLRYWAARALRVARLREQTRRLVESKRTERCQYCGALQGLQTEIIQSIEDLFLQFQRRSPAHVSGGIWDTGAWLKFVAAHAYFRTICLRCLDACDRFNAHYASVMRSAGRKPQHRKTRAVNFGDAPRVIASEDPLVLILRQWLHSARQRL